MKMKTSKELRAKMAIERGDAVCFAICTETCQIFDNVKHMKWFRDAVADELDGGFQQSYCGSSLETVGRAM